MTFKSKDVITIGQLSKEEILYILKETGKIKQDFNDNEGKEYKNMLKDRKMISAFFEDSTRTRTSFTEAMTQLGGTVQGFAGASGTSINKGESTYHTVKMLYGYGADVIVVRHKLEGTAQFLADKFDIPVINAGDGAHEHPTQTLLDLFTINESQGRLDNLTISLVGDLKYGRTVHSLAVALSLFPGNKIYLVSPSEISMPEKFLDIMSERGTEFIKTSDLGEAVKNSDIVYMTRLQKERLPDELKPLYDKLKCAFRLDRDILKDVKKNLKVLHPLPIPKDVQEISSEVEKTPYCHYFEQAKNGLYTRMAILGLTLGAIHSVKFPKKTVENEQTNFLEVNLERKSFVNMKIADIKSGLIIDHLPPNSSENVIHIMGYSSMHNVFTGRNVKSTMYGLKDILKIESEDFSLENLEPLNKLALIYPTATVNLVKDSIVVRKGHVRLPSEITGLAICANGDCITRPEYFETDETKFHVKNRDPLKLECHYCGCEFGRDKIVIKTN